MARLFKYLTLTLFLPLWYIQLLFPRKDNIWIFGAWNGQRYSDNSKYLFDYVSENHKDIMAIWITKDKKVQSRIREQGKKCYMSNSLKGIYLSLRAKFVIVSSGKNDISKLFVNGAKLVHLWHGNPLKKIGLDDNYSSANGFFYSKIVRWFYPMVYEFNYDYMVSNSQIFTPFMQSSYRLNTDQILETGCPRNDIFYSTSKDVFNIELSKRFKDSKIVYYLPTFRNSETPKNIFTQDDYVEEKVEAFLQKENIVLVNKGHFVESKTGLSGTSQNSRIVHLKDSDITSDINNMLKDADALITDYSSAFFDFLLTERPILFAAFDLQEYMSHSRELYFNYEDAVAGPIVHNWEEILFQLSTIWNDEENKKVVLQKNKIYNKYHDAFNSKRVTDALLRLSNK
ncbi:CDP-glycerol glycerophosphotransferase family protein [Maribacter sp. MAR_2009_72]|uniref:CDP-glycerol glycerophosphotransferase family protein n=1 Tax=Maribacter sp. MAR_2009_72 TaxID=1250050 RepID=UPI001199A9A7|nr:CDP-glycerol glycerophosphotransferase family protein [Maribacter sp. MAR_2009_72]TVZ16175.1 CDP-glycerol glycerophosphotransferase [Maribacter sp. MAR_2009_72]